MHKRPHVVEIIGAPLDLGANKRGANIAPATVRIAGLADKLAGLGISAIDSGDVSVPLRETLGPEAANERYLRVITDVCNELFERVQRSLGAGRFPLVIGGDHSIGIGTIKGAADYWYQQGGQLGLIWVDAHADLNTPATSPSGNLHGMPRCWGSATSSSSTSAAPARACAPRTSRSSASAASTRARRSSCARPASATTR
jgi:arginase